MKARTMSFIVLSFWSLNAEASAIPLGTAANFAVLGASTVTNLGPTVIAGGNVGVSPGSAITGFPPGVVTAPFTIHAGDAVAAQAHSDLVTAYNIAAGQVFSPANNLTGIGLGGLTLVPGVYHFDTSAGLTGKLTLDAQGDPNASFIFQIGTSLISANNSSVVLINGGEGDDLVWQVGTSATLGTNTAFTGNILADQTVTLTTGANILDGRAMALVGPVIMDTNNVSITAATAVTPEPGTSTLLSVGLILSLIVYTRRKQAM